MMLWPLVCLLGSLIILLLSGIPVAFAFGMANLITILILLGPSHFAIQAMADYNGIANFLYTAVPFFILMGEILLNADLAARLIEIISKWMAKIPARICFVTIGSGSVFGTLTGSSMAACATLGAILVPEMRRYQYDKGLAGGVVAASGALAILIPPSALMVIFGALSGISIGKLLIAGILPGLAIAALLMAYIVIRVKIQPHLAPGYAVEKIDYRQLIKETCIHGIPPILIIFMVIGFIYLGIATPSEAAATGVFGSLIVALIYGKLNFEMLNKSLLSTMRITGMILFIFTGSRAYSQLMAITGISKGIASFVTGATLPPIFILIFMLLVLVFLGMFMEPSSIMFITIPIFQPIATRLGFDPLWWGIMYMITMELGMITPPFGLNLFVTLGACPPDFHMQDLFRGIIPFIFIYLLAILVVMIFPSLATWLPAMMLGR